VRLTAKPLGWRSFSSANHPKAPDLKCKRFEASREEEAEQTLERQTARKILFWTSNLGQL
jgi:hypothetical protein